LTVAVAFYGFQRARDVGVVTQSRGWQGWFEDTAGPLIDQGVHVQHLHNPFGLHEVAGAMIESCRSTSSTFPVTEDGIGWRTAMVNGQADLIGEEVLEARVVDAVAGFTIHGVFVQELVSGV
jgi:hypothetical protein